MNGVLWFPDGRMASFDCGFVHPMRQWLEITGTAGTVFVDEMWVPSPNYAEFQVRRASAPIGESEIHTFEGHEQIQHMLENFGASIINGLSVAPAPEEAVKTLKVLDALAKSAREGKIIDV
jgi:predicted dehydrogenase